VAGEVALSLKGSLRSLNLKPLLCHLDCKSYVHVLDSRKWTVPCPNLFAKSKHFSSLSLFFLKLISVWFVKDPYFEVYAKTITDGPTWKKGQELLLYRSEIVYKNLSPQFQAFELDATIIGGIDNPFKFRVMDWDLDGADDIIGEVARHQFPLRVATTTA